MDKKSKLAMPERHKYKHGRDKFYGLSRIPLNPKISEREIRVIKNSK